MHREQHYPHGAMSTSGLGGSLLRDEPPYNDVQSGATAAAAHFDYVSRNSSPLPEPLQLAHSSLSASMYATQYQPMTMELSAFASTAHARSPSPRSPFRHQPHKHPTQLPSKRTAVSSQLPLPVAYAAAGRSASPTLPARSPIPTSLSSIQHSLLYAEAGKKSPGLWVDGHREIPQKAFWPDASGPSSSGDHHTTMHAHAESLHPAGGRVGRTPNSRLHNVDRKAICSYAKAHPEARHEDIAARYGLERSTVSKILKCKQKWMNIPEGDGLKIVNHRQSKFPVLEEHLLTTLKQSAEDEIRLTDKLIRLKARAVANDLGISENQFKASSGWLENFKNRHNIRRGVLVGRSHARDMGPGGHISAVEDSEFESRANHGEVRFSQELRPQMRQKMQEPIELFRLPEEQDMDVHGDSAEQSMINEEPAAEPFVRQVRLQAREERSH